MIRKVFILTCWLFSITEIELLPAQLSPPNPSEHIQVPVFISQVPCFGFVQLSGHVFSKFEVKRGEGWIEMQCKEQLAEKDLLPAQ